MAPRTPSTTEDIERLVAPTRGQKGEDGEGASSAGMRASGMWHKTRLSAALLANDAAAVFEQMYMLPVLQALGTPVALVTMSGCVSAVLAIGALPLCGWLSDGGANSRKRKKPAVLGSTLLLLLGLGLVLTGNALHLWTSTAATSSGRDGAVTSTNDSESASVTSSDVLHIADGFGPFAIYSNTKNASTRGLRSAATVRDASPGAENLAKGAMYTAASGPHADKTFMDAVTAVPKLPVQHPATTARIPDDVKHVSASLHTNVKQQTTKIETEIDSGPDGSPSSEASNTPDTASGLPAHQDWSLADDTIKADPPGVVFGLPLGALLAMAGFVFLDLGYDLTNASVKTYMLSVSKQVDHVSLLITGVLLSALGGCLTALTGLLDLGSLLGATLTTGNAVSSQAVVQLLVIVILILLSTCCTLLSAPSDAVDPGQAHMVTVLPEAPDEGGKEEVGVGVGAGVRVDLDCSTATLQTEVQESIIMATTSPADTLGLSVSTRVERIPDLSSLSLRLGRPPALPEAHDKTALLDAKVSYKTLQISKPVKHDQKRRKRNLFVICLTTFFTGASLFLFVFSVTDYVGKILYGGDPEAEPGSAELAQYEEGLRTGASGMLTMSVAYVIFSLVHCRVLTFLGPRLEYLLVSALVGGLLLSLQISDAMALYYVSSAVMGLYRAVLYTVPFMLANQQCHQGLADQESQPQTEHGGHRHVGSTMALVTCALPCAFLMVCAVTGPLIEVTGDPGAPMMLSVVFCCLAAITFICYRP